MTELFSRKEQAEEEKNRQKSLAIAWGTTALSPGTHVQHLIPNYILSHDAAYEESVVSKGLKVLKSTHVHVLAQCIYYYMQNSSSSMLIFTLPMPLPNICWNFRGLYHYAHEIQ